MIRLLCVEDDPLVRAFLAVQLGTAPEVHIVGFAGDTESASTFIKDEEVDVVLLDYQLPGRNGTYLLRLVRDQQATAAAVPGRRRPVVLFYTSYADSDFEAEVRELGAAGVVAKDRAAAELIPAVRTVAQGGRWFHPLPHQAPARPVVIVRTPRQAS